MANIKITDLVTLTEPVSTDVLPIVDVSLDVTKKISIAELLKTAGQGSQTNPGISFDGDTDTGVYSPGANQLAFTTNGSEALRITSDGRVGIGTTDPATQFVVSDSGAAGFEVGPTINSRVTLTAYNRSTSAFEPMQIRSDELLFASENGAEAARIDSSGRLLVGTSSAYDELSPLEVVGSGAEYGLFATNSTGFNLAISKARGTFASPAVVANGDTLGQIAFKGYSGSASAYRNAAYITAQVDGEPDTGGDASDMPGRLVFATTADGASNPTERMRITSAGLVGIGTSSPDELLHIEGDVAEFKGTNTNSINVTGGTEQVFKFGIEGQKNAVFGPAGSIIFRQDGSTWSSVDANNKPTRIEFCTQDGTTTDTSETPRLVVDQNGKVAIGTSNPGATLDVNGDIRARTITSDTVYSTANMYALQNVGGTLSSILWRFVTGANDVTAGTERARIDSSGRLLVGTSTAYPSYTGTPQFQISGTGTSDASAMLRCDVNTQTGASIISFTKSRGAKGTQAIVQSNDYLGFVTFAGSDGTNFIAAARIDGQVDGTPGSNDMPGRLVFSTTADGASAPTERMRIDSSGRVGINTTSPVLGVVHINQGTASFSLNLQNNSSNESGIIFGRNGTPSASSTAIVGNGEAAGYLTFATGGSERARIDSSGRLLLGVSTARVGANFKDAGYTTPLQLEGAANNQSYGPTFIANSGTTNNTVRGCIATLGRTRGTALNSNTAVASGDFIGRLQFSGADGTNLVPAASITAYVDGTPGTDDMPGRLVFSTTADGASSPTERMRINSTGSILFADEDESAITAGTSNGKAILSSSIMYSARATTAAASQIIFTNTNGIVGQISTSGSNTAFSTASDYRLKENVVPLANAADRLNQLQVHRFNFIADPDTTVDGFLAHEAQAVVPECVTGTKDEVDDEGNPVYQCIDQSKIVPLLTAALQEALAKIETLEQRLTDAGIS